MTDIIEARARLTDWLATHDLRHGVGTREAACSMAAINFALSGWVNDKRPECVCPVIHAWIIPIQDALPLGTGPFDLNGARWKSLLPLVAGTNDGREAKRAAIIMKWMWETVLPQLQPLADARGFAAASARAAAAASARATRAAAAEAWAASARAAGTAAGAAAEADYFEAIDAPGMLERLVNLPEREDEE